MVSTLLSCTKKCIAPVISHQLLLLPNSKKIRPPTQKKKTINELSRHVTSKRIRILVQLCPLTS